MGTVSVFRAVLRNRDLRRVELAYAAFNASEYAVWLAMLVYAYRRGGTTEASLVAALQLVPAAICAPFLALLADRHRPVAVLLGGYLAQALGMGATAIALIADAPVPIVYAGAVFAASAVTITRPAQAVIVPSLARTADELTATNVVSSAVESGGSLLASVLTGVLLSVAGVALVFSLMAGLVLAAALLVSQVRGPDPAASGDDGNALGEVFAGFGALREHTHLRLLIGVLMTEFLLWGAMDIVFVVLALDLLLIGQGWVGYFNAVFGLGGILGGFAAVMLVGRRHLTPPIALGILLFGGALIVIAISPTTIVAALMLGLSGAGRILLDIGCRTLLQRTTPSEVLGRVFGLLEGLEMAALALGALLIPVFVAIGGARAALVGAGLLLPVLGLLLARSLIGVDRRAKVPIVEIALLRSISLFAPLPAPELEGLARALERVELPAGTVVVLTGEIGDRFYAIAGGEVEVSREGTIVARLARGAGFGEIALLEDIPRTATVTAGTDVLLYALEKDPFITAVTGHPPAAQAASTLVSERREGLAQIAAEDTITPGV